MKKKNIGNLVIIGLVVLNVIMWTVFPPINDGRPNFARQYMGEVIGSTMLILMASGFFLTTRAKWAEPYFGGLDKMYLTHKRVNTTAFLLIFVHILVVPITTTNLLLGNYLAMIAFAGIVTIVLLTLAPRIPFLSKLTNASYDQWRNIHRYIGIFYVIAFFHSITINALSALIAFTYVQTIFLVGLACYLYTEIFSRFFKKSLSYSVSGVRHLNGNTTEVTLTPKKDRLTHQPGQFLFVRFPGDKVLNESHPFTISSAPGEDAIRLTIKASGDFTRYLFHNLRPGMDATLEGAHGLFQHRFGGQKQTWVAGGIGITPFLSFMRHGNIGCDVDFYYTVRTREEALFLDEIDAAAKQNPNFRPFVRYSIENGSLTADEIVKNSDGNFRERHVYMCGPYGMMKAFDEKFKAHGLSADNIHFEEFNFR
jgi:predicted ferric reductase